MSDSMLVITKDEIDDIKKSATIKIRENLLRLKNLFSVHSFNFMTMCDDMLSVDSDYFVVQYFGNPITKDGLKGFILTTTSIYSGIFSQNHPLKLHENQNYYESCDISFDKNQQIVRVEFKITLNKGSNKEFINLLLNSKFEIINFTWRVLYSNKDVFVNDVNYKGFAIPDFIKFLKLKCNANEQIIELLPELIVPSAYNMNTAEFNNRLEIVDMILS